MRTLSEVLLIVSEMSELAAFKAELEAEAVDFFLYFARISSPASGKKKDNYK